jgi:hypothetical protein
VQIGIGSSYSVLQGTIDGGVMNGEGSNQEAWASGPGYGVIKIIER